MPYPKEPPRLQRKTLLSFEKGLLNRGDNSVPGFVTELVNCEIVGGKVVGRAGSKNLLPATFSQDAWMLDETGWAACEISGSRFLITVNGKGQVWALNEQYPEILFRVYAMQRTTYATPLTLPFTIQNVIRYQAVEPQQFYSLDTNNFFFIISQKGEATRIDKNGIIEWFYGSHTYVGNGAQYFSNAYNENISESRLLIDAFDATNIEYEDFYTINTSVRNVQPIKGALRIAAVNDCGVISKWSEPRIIQDWQYSYISRLPGYAIDKNKEGDSVLSSLASLGNTHVDHPDKNYLYVGANDSIGVTIDSSFVGQDNTVVVNNALMFFVIDGNRKISCFMAIPKSDNGANVKSNFHKFSISVPQEAYYSSAGTLAFRGDTNKNIEEILHVFADNYSVTGEIATSIVSYNEDYTYFLESSSYEKRIHAVISIRNTTYYSFRVAMTKSLESKALEMWYRHNYKTMRLAYVSKADPTPTTINLTLTGFNNYPEGVPYGDRIIAIFEAKIDCNYNIIYPLLSNGYTLISEHIAFDCWKNIKKQVPFDVLATAKYDYENGILSFNTGLDYPAVVSISQEAFNLNETLSGSLNQRFAIHFSHDNSVLISQQGFSNLIGNNTIVDIVYESDNPAQIHQLVNVPVMSLHAKTQRQLAPYELQNVEVIHRLSCAPVVAGNGSVFIVDNGTLWLSDMTLLLKKNVEINGFVEHIVSYHDGILVFSDRGVFKVGADLKPIIVGDGIVAAKVISSKGNVLAVNYDGTVSFYTVFYDPSGAARVKVNDISEPIIEKRFSPNSKLCAVGNIFYIADDKEVYGFSIAENEMGWKRKYVFDAHIQSLFSYNNDLVVALGEDADVLNIFPVKNTGGS